MQAASVLLIEEGGRGGTTDYVGQLVRALAAEGVRVDLATATDHRFGPMPAGVTIHPLFHYYRGGTPLRDAVRRLKLHKLLNGLSYLAAIVRLLPVARRTRLVHLQGFELPPLVLVVIALMRATGATVLMTPHNTFGRKHGLDGTRNWMLRAARALIVHTRFDVGELPPEARPRAHVIPHGDYGPLAAEVGPADREAERGKLGIPLGAPVALCFGQLRPDKGIADVVLAAQAIPELWVILAGEELGALEECRPLLAADPGLAARVVMRPGFATLEEAAGFFAAADVTVMAYRVASMSGVLLLGYGFARPALVYPVGGLPEAVRDGETGWICARADVPALVETLAAVVAAGPEECLRRGVAGRHLARTAYAWDAIARQTIAVYAGVAPRPRRRS